MLAWMYPSVPLTPDRVRIHARHPPFRHDGRLVTRATAAPIQVVRSPADILRVVVAIASLIVVIVMGALFEGAVSFTHDLLRGVDGFSESFVTAVVIGVRVATIAFLAIGLLVAIIRGRWRLVMTVVVAAAAGAVVFAVFQGLLDDQAPALVTVSDWAGPLTSASFPTATGVAIAAAVVTAAGPWLARGYRRLGWVLTLALAAVVFAASPDRKSVV